MNVVIRLAALFVALGADGATAQQATPDALDLAAPAAHRTTTLYLAIGHDDFRADDGGDGRTELQARFVRFGADFDLTETVGAPFYVGLSIDRRQVESEVQLTGFPVEIEGDGVAGAAYAAVAVQEDLILGLSGDWTRDSGDFVTFFGPASASLETVSISPFVLGYASLGAATLRLGASATYSRSRLKIAGVKQHLDVVQVETGAQIAYSPAPELLLELGADLIATVREETIFNAPRTDDLTLRASGGFRLRLTQSASLRVEGRYLALDGDLTDYGVALRFEHSF